MLFLYYFLIDNPNNLPKFNKIVKDYQNRIYHKALSITKDSHYANEAVQAAIVSIAKHIESIETDNEVMLKSYIYTIAQNAGIDAWRRMKSRDKIANIDDYADIPSEEDILEKNRGR